MKMVTRCTLMLNRPHNGVMIVTDEDGNEYEMEAQ